MTDSGKKNFLYIKKIRKFKRKNTENKFSPLFFLLRILKERNGRKIKIGKKERRIKEKKEEAFSLPLKIFNYLVLLLIGTSSTIAYFTHWTGPYLMATRRTFWNTNCGNFRFFSAVWTPLYCCKHIFSLLFVVLSCCF